MISVDQYKTLLDEKAGETIAVVYVFEGDDALGYEHYDAWKSDVICSWLQAIQEMHCLPLIMDLRTFMQKSLDRSLPHIDYVINLNNGTYSLSTLGLLPSLCAYLSIPCIPCNTVQIIAGENKKISNLIATNNSLTVPKDVVSHGKSGIYRPVNLGSSCGVHRSKRPVDITDALFQEFIPGFDLTTPIMYNPLAEELHVLPAIMYIPENRDINWFLGETEKSEHAGYYKHPVYIENEIKGKFIQMCKWLGIKTYCRIDCRVLCRTVQELDDYTQKPIPFDRIRFLEINPMPTVKTNINFHKSLASILADDPIKACLDIYFSAIPDASYTGFILSSSMIALSTATH